MKQNFPKTPFATRLSGDAKETELRIRNIFQWKKKRPPLWFLALLCAVVLGCGWLVGCQERTQLPEGADVEVHPNAEDFFVHYRSDFPVLEESPVPPSPDDRPFVRQDTPENLAEQIVQDYYYNTMCFKFDEALTLVGDDALRQATQNEAKIVANSTGSGAELNGSWVTAPLAVTALGENRSETVSSFHRLSIGRDGTGTWASYFDSDIPESWRSFTYQAEGDTLHLAFQDGTTEEYTISLAYDYLCLDVRGELQFYREPGRHFSELMIHSLTTLSRENFFPGGGYFEDQAWSNAFLTDLLEEVAKHDLTEYTVVCADLSWKWTDAALAAGPQIDSGRYERPILLGRTGEDDSWKIYELYWGEITFNRSLAPYNDPQAEQLARLGLEDYEYYNYTPKLTTLLYQTIGSHSLMLVESQGYPHLVGLNNLVMGVWDEERGAFVGETYALGGDEPGYTSWLGTDGCLYVLWTNTTYYQGAGTSHGIDFFRFDGQTLEPIRELPTCALTCGVLPEGAKDILGPDESFWANRKAWPVTQGFELYSENTEWNSARPGEGEQWLYVGYVPFAITDSSVTNGVKDLIREYIETTWYGYERTYYLGEEPGEPQEWDQRIDGVSYAGEEITDETTGVAFRVDRSYYATWSSEDPGPTWRRDETSIYVILGRSMDGETYADVRGFVTPNSERSLNQMILEITYDLMDLEVSLWRDGYPWPVGPGSEVHFFRDVYDGEAQVEVLEGWEPIYWPGAYWTRQSWDGFSALCYHVGEEPGQPDPDAYSIYTIDTTRTDLQTYRGIRVGSTRTEVLEAYPVLYDTEYWNATAPDFPGDDYLWYCVNSDGFGAALLFFFEEDVVTQIRLNHMFN